MKLTYSWFQPAFAAFALVVSLATSALVASADGTGCQATITTDQPAANATIQGSNTLSGWAIDPSAASGSNSGVQDVLVYRDGQAGAGGVLIGEATKVARPDIDSRFGLNGAQTGWMLNADFSTTTPGSHTLYVYAVTGCGWSYGATSVVVGSAKTGAEINIDSPSVGQAVGAGQLLQIGGWAADTSAAGTGVDQVHIYVDGQAGGTGTMLGAAAYGGVRSDVAAARKKTDWANSGFDFSWTVSGLTPGTHTLYVYAHSPTGQWSFKTVDIAVTGGTTSPPTTSSNASAVPSTNGATAAPSTGTQTTVVKITSPTSGATATGTVYLRGLAANCATGDSATSVRIFAGGPNGALLGEALLSPASNNLAGICGTGAVGSGGTSWEYTIPGGDNPQGGPRTFAVVASFSTGTATDSVSVNTNGRNGGGPPNGYNNQGSNYSNGACSAGYASTNGQCVYDGGNSYCPAGYVSQNGGCVNVGNQGR